MTSGKFLIPPDTLKSISLNEIISKPDKWSAEHPNLYTLTFELLSSSGKTEEVITGRIGFKETEIRNQVFYLNGIPVN